ncbi:MULTISPECIES: hypothetical protein [Pseudanabaena]|uniref:hypothetical protein n=1 Tax=Pseudanabaena TaxID=1152 RepID=UPI002479C3B6|nr:MULTISPECIES: hypothetical protein [Pseudanabaena]MEA5490221.1 hypothetical protein [Pseudanabaena sp. CCNP1317]WGS74694.1 hypothetical protein OA858_23125 [Pseudanabaena galeata CCNP1313]
MPSLHPHPTKPINSILRLQTIQHRDRHLPHRPIPTPRHHLRQNRHRLTRPIILTQLPSRPTPQQPTNHRKITVNTAR